MVAGAARALEDRVVAETAALCRGLERERLDQDRRPLRLSVRELDFQPGPARRVALAFSLPSGAYATTVLGELFAFDRFRRAS